MRGRLITFLIILGLGGLGTWQILQSSRPAAIVFGIAIALLALTAFLGRRTDTKGGRSADKLPPSAVALRQSRAMTRAEDGEIRGLPGGPA